MHEIAGGYRLIGDGQMVPGHAASLNQASQIRHIQSGKLIPLHDRHNRRRAPLHDRVKVNPRVPGPENTIGSCVMLAWAKGHADCTGSDLYPGDANGTVETGFFHIGSVHFSSCATFRVLVARSYQSYPLFVLQLT